MKSHLHPQQILGVDLVLGPVRQQLGGQGQPGGHTQLRYLGKGQKVQPKPPDILVFQQCGDLHFAPQQRSIQGFLAVIPDGAGGVALCQRQGGGEQVLPDQDKLLVQAADDQAFDVLLAEVLDLLALGHSTVIQVLNLLRTLVKAAPGLGQGGLACAAVEQGKTQLPLQVADLLG